MTQMITSYEIAAACFEAIRVVKIALSETPEGHWADLPLRRQEDFLAGVQVALSRKMTPQSMHDAWCVHMEDQGYIYGPVVDHVAKAHPDLARWAEVTPGRRVKDELFLAIVEILRPLSGSLYELLDR